MSEAPGRVGLGRLSWRLLRLGATAFGGLGAALALLERDLVQRHGWLESRDLSDALAFTKPLPGSTVVQVVAFLGYRLRRWPGAILASVAFIAPATVFMAAAAAATAALPPAGWARGLFDGISVAVVGLLAHALWSLARGQVRSWALGAVGLTALGLGFLLNAALIVIAAGIVGALAGRRHDNA